VFQTRFVSRIQVKKLLNRYTGLFFLRFHTLNIHPMAYLCQGDNSVKECALPAETLICPGRAR
jgi:hypothetical protein